MTDPKRAGTYGQASQLPESEVELSAPGLAENQTTETARTQNPACSCKCGSIAQMVFPIGQLGIDFGTEARRASILSHMGESANPYDAKQLDAYLRSNPWDAAAIIWTLNSDATPIYAIQPCGSF